MHFTVIFDSHESHDISYGLVFVPCPVWVKGDAALLNLHRDNPHYERGDLKPLLEHERLETKLAGSRRAVVVVHSTGHGSSEYLNRLKADLLGEGFSIQVVRFDAEVPS